MTTAPFLRSKLCIEGHTIPLDFVSLLHPSIQHCQSEARVLNWASMYGILRRGRVTRVLSTESVPLWIVICFDDYEDEYYLMDMDEWYEMGPYIKPVEGLVTTDWTREGF